MSCLLNIWVRSPFSSVKMEMWHLRYKGIKCACSAAVSHVHKRICKSRDMWIYGSKSPDTADTTPSTVTIHCLHWKMQPVIRQPWGSQVKSSWRLNQFSTLKRSNILLWGNRGSELRDGASVENVWGYSPKACRENRSEESEWLSFFRIFRGSPWAKQAQPNHSRAFCGWKWIGVALELRYECVEERVSQTWIRRESPKTKVCFLSFLSGYKVFGC